ncbi:MAG: diaminopimelate epimerase [Bacteroidota bacterium]
MDLTFYKYQGTGNDFIMIDNRQLGLEHRLNRDQIAHLCDRKFGIGADGLILLSPDEEVDFRMIYYNSDGGESTMCGNGGRCLAAFADQIGIEQEGYRFRAVDGFHDAVLAGQAVSLSMMPPKGFTQLSQNNYWINSGSPHYVRFCDQPIEEVDIDAIGSAIRYSAAYESIGGTNVNVVNRVGEGQHLKVRTYERGVEGETLSCGTGVTACAYVSLLISAEDHKSQVILDTPGGQLQVKVEHAGTEKEVVWLSGPATFVFEGTVNLEL